ncbi:MAG: hypothetical protein GC192_21410 [Bacteroidetes bacterium]|nr:hypothetical protein [Bacteroidota bacterium]
METNKKQIEASKNETAIEVVAVALEAVPLVGGVLGGTASFLLNRRKDKRIQDFLMSLADDLKAHKDYINSEFIKQERFIDLTEEVLQRAGDNWQKEKLNALKNIYVNTVIAGQPSYDEATEIIWLVHNLQPRHVVVLKILSDPRKADKQMGDVVGDGGGFATSFSQIFRKLLPEWEEEQIERTWNDLYERKIHKSQGTKAMMTDQGINHLEGRLTEFGQRVAYYLKDNSQL